MAPKAQTADEMRARFVFEKLDEIVGEPTHATINKLQQQVIRNLATVKIETLSGPHGLASLAETPAAYFLRAGAHFNRPAYPGATPTYPIIVSDAQRETTRLAHAELLATFTTIITTEAIALGMIEKAIDSMFIDAIADEAHGFGTNSLHDVFRYLFATCCMDTLASTTLMNV